jgi:hypothetical protein
MLFDLNTNKKLGAKEVKFNEGVLDIKTKATRFAMKSEELKKYGVKLADVSDVNGLLMATQALGDKIAATIRKGSNLTSLNFKKLVNKEGKLGDNAVTVALISADLYEECFDWEARQVNMKKAALKVAGRKGTKMPVLYTPQDIQKSSNKYNVVREIMTVNDFYLTLCKAFLNSINEDTTLEELETFQSAFEFPTRGLGEQTIDVCKHIDYTFVVDMDDLISPYVTVLGGVKKFESNIDEARRKNAKELYEITAPEPRRNTIRLDDCIGDMKQISVDVMESTIRDYITSLDNNNYDNYKQYENIKFANEKEVELVYLIDKVEDSILTMDDDTKERCLYAIYKKAEEYGIDKDRVIKLALKLAISQQRKTKRGTVLVSVLGTSAERKADIWKVATLFSDIFVAEYAGVNILEVEVDYESEVDIAVDTVIEIQDGYGLNGQLQVFGPFQNGQVKVVEKDGLYKLVALYNPLETLMNKFDTNTIVIPIEGYSKENVNFKKFTKSAPEDIDMNESFGYSSIANNDLARLLRHGDNLYLFGVENDNNPTPAAKADAQYNYASSSLNLTNTVPFKGFVLADVIK